MHCTKDPLNSEIIEENGPAINRKDRRRWDKNWRQTQAFHTERHHGQILTAKRKSQKSNIIRMARNEEMNFKKETQKQKKKNYHLLRDHCLLGSVSGVVYLLVDLILKAILCGIYNTDITLVMLNMPCPWPSPRSSIVSCWCRGPETR